MIVTGQTNSSRLSELRKFTASADITKQYFGGGSWTNNGVDFSQLEYTDTDVEFRSYGEDEGEFRLHGEDEDDFRITSGPILMKIVYYIDGIKFTDYILDGITIFEYEAVGINNPNFIHAPYYKDPKKENIISLPKIDNDVFIIRQQLSAFEGNYMLEYINNLSELRTFVGGNYFNIVNNS